MLVVSLCTVMVGALVEAMMNHVDCDNNNTQIKRRCSKSNIITAGSKMRRQVEPSAHSTRAYDIRALASAGCTACYNKR
jgi:hypothetical protein